MVIAHHLLVLFVNGTAKLAAPGAAPPGARAIHHQSHEPASVEACCASPCEGRSHSDTSECGIQSFGEVGQGMVTEGTMHARSRTNWRARQRFNVKKTELPQPWSEQQSPDQNLSCYLRRPPPVPGRLQVLL